MPNTTTMKQTIALRLLNDFERKAFWSLIVLAALFSAIYVYCISASIVNIVLREHMAQATIETHAKIGELESAYLVKKDAITSAYANQLGFVPITDKTFVTRATAGQVLTLNR